MKKNLHFQTLCLLYIAGVLLVAGGCQAQTLASPQSPSLTPPSAKAGSASSEIADDANQATGTKKENPIEEKNVMEKATFGAGCFWCVEAVFQQLKGVSVVKSGYMGGSVKNPTYQAVCTGLTGHAEVIQVEYDPAKISFAELLEVFWKTHDPTTLNQQGADRGTQYRSAVFYHNDEQKQLAESYKKKLNAAHAFPNPIVTEITAASQLYIAEGYHQNYFNNNQDNPYCRLVIPPKLEKLRQVFGDKLKD